MHADSSLDPGRSIRERTRNQPAASREQKIEIWCVLSLCLFIACAHTGEIIYLSAAEIRESIVGNSLKEAESGYWREDYLPANAERLEGIIRGHQTAPDGPYRGVWSIAGDSMCIEFPELTDQDGCYRFARGEGSEILWFDSEGVVDIESVLVERGDAESGVVEFAPPAFRRETIEFPHRENRVVGDLRFPSGSPPYPAIAFVHGSGAATRHSYYLESIGDEFLRRGFATLIWSKPGIDESTGDYLKQSMADRAEEVAAAMMYLAEREEIDGDRIGLWGISQAGWVMPMAPAHRDVAFVISVSGSARTGREQDLYGVENELIRIGFSHDELADALDHRRQFYDLIHEGLKYEEFELRQEEWLADMKSRSWYPTLESNLDELVFQSLVMSKDPRRYEFVSINDVDGYLMAPPELKNLDMPVLAIYGSEDPLVDANLGSTAYREIPRMNGNPDVTVKVFERADHGIMQSDSDGYLDFAPGFLATMGEWLAEHR